MSWHEGERSSRAALRRAWLLATGMVMAAGALAFAPGGGVHVYPASKTHGEITEEALATVYASAGLTTVSNSMKAARKQFVEANKAVDNDQFSSRKHFDGENFAGGQSEINGLLSKAVTQAKAGDFSNARTSVGAALHTVQDFYAHSNWVELGNSAPSAEVGRPGAISNTSPVGDLACVRLPAVCNVSNLVTSRLTSGYYGKEDAVILPGKCRHGGFFDSGPGADGLPDLTGISKDSAVCLVTGAGLVDSPHSDFNPAAAAVAVRATVQVFDDLKSKLSTSEFKSLLGVGPSLAFSIDTTGSMGSIIAGVRSAAISIVNSRLGTEQEPSKYVLSPFNDPSTGPATSTADANAFKAAIGALGASGGGDCPELSMAGSYSAVDLSDDRGDVFVFTDASSKDASLAFAVSSLASTKRVKVFYALFGSCSPYDPAYFSVANASGGQVFTLAASEAGTVTRLSDILARNNAVDVESRQGSVVTGAPVTIPFSVDSSMSKLNVSYSDIDATTLTLYRPDGVIVTPSTPGVSTIALSNGVIYSINPPAAGVWRAVIGGSGQYSLLVNGESQVALDQFDFAELAGRGGHQGYYAITGLPLVGKTYKAVARLSGSPASVAFEFRDLDGATIAPFALADADVEAHYLAGDVRIPSQSFRVYATGADAGGTAFQRLIATVVFPQTVSVNPPAAVDLGQGQTSSYVFEVRNEGPAATFVFAAKDTAGFVSGSMTPASATLATGASALTKVTLKVGAAIPVGTRDSLTVTATDAADAARRNFAVLTSSVVAPKVSGDVNRDGVVDCGDLNLVKASFGSRTGSRAFNPDVDVDGNGVIDARDLAFVARLVPAGTVCK
ncbi:hypothetical protein CKO44_03240 [Rubrivivax gelatinosus]|uniref:dockerin type I domain-containing protein n=1 Tax=Rubrivivax gelatinosus TaxID=28068 RepID=UPI001907024C|nr:dockerin type I domain-containing protein [Rubrivivax gelatinosus]MBK1612477.1 hypothetical protein [Rubrivivax gelatinosus]